MAILNKQLYRLMVTWSDERKAITVAVEPGTTAEQIGQIAPNLPAAVTEVHEIELFGDCYVIHTP